MLSFAKYSAAKRSSRIMSKSSDSFSLTAGPGMAIRRFESLKASSIARNWAEEQSNISFSSFSVAVLGHGCYGNMKFMSGQSSRVKNAFQTHVCQVLVNKPLFGSEKAFGLASALKDQTLEKDYADLDCKNLKKMKLQRIDKQRRSRVYIP